MPLRNTLVFREKVVKKYQNLPIFLKIWSFYVRIKNVANNNQEGGCIMINKKNNFVEIDVTELEETSGGYNAYQSGGTSSGSGDAYVCGAYAWGYAGQLSGYGCGSSQVYAEQLSKYCTP